MNQPIKIRFGSQDSRDIDYVYLVPVLPGFQECKAFCDMKEDNRNIASLDERGLVKECYKGVPDETNNAIFYTYSLHEQKHPNPISGPVKRIAPLKIVVCNRKILSSLTRTEYRPQIKESLKSQDYTRRKKALEEIDFRKIELSPDQLKLIAFQLAQTNALIQGNEFYTKQQLAEAFPELEPHLYRDTSAERDTLNQQRDFLSEQTRNIYTRKDGALNLFCFQSAPSIKNWNLFALQSRGIVIDVKKERCVQYPFDKFFRVDEVAENVIESIPEQTVATVSEKIDGSMISCFMNDGKVMFACKGNFGANQALEAEQISRQKEMTALNFDKYFYIFEVLYPKNRFPNTDAMGIIDYGEKKDLILVGLRDRLTNRLLPYTEVVKEAQHTGFSHPRIERRNLRQLIQEVQESEEQRKEGYVAEYEGRLMKVKYPWFTRTNKIIHDIRKNRFVKKWVSLPHKQREKLIDSLPPEFRELAQEQLNRFETTKQEIRQRFQFIIEYHKSELPNYAVKNLPKELQRPFFRFWRGQKGEEWEDLLEKRALVQYEEGVQNGRRTCD